MVAPLATIAAVAVVAAGTGLLASRGGQTPAGSPPALHLLGASNLAAPVAAGNRSRPVVSGTLPSGPDHGQVFRFTAGTVGAAPESLVADLARTLGLSGHPVRTRDSWVVRDGDRTLTVSNSAGWQWSYAPFAVEIPISGPPVSTPVVTPTPAAPPASTPSDPAEPSDPAQPVPIKTVPTMSCLVIINGRRACPPATPLPRHGGTLAPGASIPEQPGGVTSGTATGSEATGATGAPGASEGSPGSRNGTSGSSGGSIGSLPARPAPVPPTPDRDAVRAAARPLLAALGLNGARLAVTTLPGHGQVTADPAVGGLPTSGLSTLLAFASSPRLHLVSGSGWLADPRAGARYPIAPAHTVLTRTPLLRCDPCDPTVGRATVTGARFGLALERDDHGVALLVPAWLYDVRGSDRPLALVAIDPHFLAKPRPFTDVTGSASGSRAVKPVPPIGGARPPASPIAPTPRPTR
ncbi:MAG TPA: hypothetical protein VFX70_19830 [Mycobacteriales bacterium]|nr:hypothetical protein [Mycobacteriales bacterium]